MTAQMSMVEMRGVLPWGNGQQSIRLVSKLHAIKSLRGRVSDSRVAQLFCGHKKLRHHIILKTEI